MIEIRHCSRDRVLLTVEAETLVGVDLSGQNLSEAGLSGADLRGANLQGMRGMAIDLRQGNLEGVNLAEARLFRGKLEDANLTACRLAGTSLCEASLQGADFTAADLTGAHLNAASLAGARLPQANLTGANLPCVDLSGADLTGARLIRACLVGARLRNCKLDGAELSGTVFDAQTVWPEDYDPLAAGAVAVVPGADLRGLALNGLWLSRLDLGEVDLTGADLSHAMLIETNLRGGNLASVDLTETELHHVLWDARTVWPEGFAPDGHEMHWIGPEAQLSGVDLVDALLEGADLTGAQLARTDLRLARLRGARLWGADLRRANLLGADLREADLEGALLEGVLADGYTLWPEGFAAEARGVYSISPGAMLAGADLRGAKLYVERWQRPVDSGIHLEGADLSGADLRDARLYGASLRGCDLSGADLSNAELCMADLSEANLQEATLEQAGLREVRLERADLTRARLLGANLDNANLTAATLVGADLTGARLYQTDLREADLTDVVLTEERSHRTTRWPEGFYQSATGGRHLVPPGLSSRLLAEADLPAIATLAEACRMQDGGLPHASTEAFVATHYSMGDEGGVWGAFVKGVLIVSAGVQLAPPEQEYGVSVVGHVHPAYRRRNLGRVAMQWSERSAGEYLALAPDRPRVLRLTTESFTEAAGRLYEEFGWKQQFVEAVMRRDLREPLPVADHPAGVRLQAWTGDLAPAFFTVYTAAFRERPGFPGWDASTWIDWATGDDGFRPEWSLLATVGGEPVGFIVCAEGWIVQVGVLPEWRGRGLGTSLVVEALRRMQAAGAAEVYLDVNVNNPGPTRLYARLGFQVVGRRARYEREV